MLLMEIQLIRQRLIKELADLPDVTTPEIHSYALTTAVLVRRITEALNITDLRIEDAWARETSHNLAQVLNKIVHYRDFGRALVGQQEGEELRDDYVYLRSKRTEPGWVINLGTYFDYIRKFAYDDIFVVRYLLRRVDTLLCNVVNQPGRDFYKYWLADVADRIHDSFALLGQIVRSRTVLVSPDMVINGYLEAHIDRHTVPSSIVENVPYGQMFAAYHPEQGEPVSSTWHRFVGGIEKHLIDGSEAYMLGVLRFPTGAPRGEVIFFRMSDLLEMFKDLRQQV